MNARMRGLLGKKSFQSMMTMDARSFQQRLRRALTAFAGACAVLSTVNAFALTSTTTSLAVTPSSPQAGQSVTLSAVVNGSNPTGTVTFKDGSSTLGSSAIAGDSYWSNVSLQLHGDGANGSTAIADSAGVNSIAANGTASIETATVKFGSGAIQLSNGSAGWLTMPGNSQLDLSSGDFTVELWLYATSSGPQIVMNKAAGTGYYPWQIFINSSGAIEWRGFSTGGASLVYDITGSAVTTNNWHHVAAVRSGSTFTLYLDGAVAGSATYSGALFDTVSDPLCVGAYQSGIYSLNGFVDDIRITKGIARYLASFPVPSAAFPNGTPAATLNVGTLAGGAHGLTAVYNGDASNAASTSAQVNVTVPGSQTTTALSATPNPAAAGQSVTISAVVSGSAPTGLVTFADGATTLGSAAINSGTATFSTNTLALGTHSLVANYAGDTNNLGSTSSSLSFVVNQASTVTTISASATAASVGQSVTLTASVSGYNPDGNLIFRDGESVLGQVSLNSGTATLAVTTLGTGSHDLSASYQGNSNNLPSVSGVVSVLIDAGSGTSGGAMTWQYTYDAQGNETSIADPNGNLTVKAYDALSRMVTLAQPVPVAGGAAPLIGVSYDGQDNTTGVVDPRQLSTSYVINGLGEKSSDASPDRGLISSTYDAAGNLLTRTDARGKTTSYTYDSLNRLTRIAYPTGTPTTFEFDGGTSGAPNSVGHLTKMTDESGSTAFTYDGLGRLLTKTQTVGTGPSARTFIVGYSWGTTGSATGKLVAMTYPSGAVVNYSYDVAGRVSGATLTPVNTNGIGANSGVSVGLLSGVAYNGANALAGWTWGNGTSYRRSYDGYGRLTSYQLGNPSGSGMAAGLSRALQYDNAAQITGYVHTNGGGQAQAPFDQSFGYDGLSRLVSASFSSTSYGYAYDASGNRSGMTLSGVSYPNTVDGASNRLLAAQGPSGTHSYAFDAAGNVTSDGVNSFSYSDRGRLSTMTVATGQMALKYNGMEQRVSKIGSAVANGTGAAYYVYDEVGQLIGEYDASGVPLYETVYVNGIPVIVVSQSRTNSGSTLSVQTVLSNIYADNLNAPRVITRSTDDAVVWRWDGAEPFGATPPDQNPTGLGVYSFDLRFPGQIADIETGNFYNWHRDYNPALGRYVQSDPIGLDGGINTYSYSFNRPLDTFDADGRNPAAVIRAARIGWEIGETLSPYVEPYIEKAIVDPLVEKSYEDQQKAIDHENYHRTCDRPPPPNLTPCEEARWRYRQAKSCQRKREEWEERWGDENSQAPHERALQNVKDRLRRAAEDIAKFCRCEQ